MEQIFFAWYYRKYSIYSKWFECIFYIIIYPLLCSVLNAASIAINGYTKRNNCYMFPYRARIYYYIIYVRILNYLFKGSIMK